MSNDLNAGWSSCLSLLMTEAAAGQHAHPRPLPHPPPHHTPLCHPPKQEVGGQMWCGGRVYRWTIAAPQRILLLRRTHAHTHARTLLIFRKSLFMWLSPRDENTLAVHEDLLFPSRSPGGREGCWGLRSRSHTCVTKKCEHAQHKFGYGGDVHGGQQLFLKSWPIHCMHISLQTHLIKHF